MDLARIAAAIRPRPPYEAIDLGTAMLRRFWRPIYATWLLTVLPLWALAFVTLELPMALLVLWWLRPLCDRVPLFVLSRALFGATPSLGALLRALPGMLVRGTLHALTFGRLDPLRTFHLPVRELEGLRGPPGYARCRQLRRPLVGTGMGLLTACVLFELTLLVATLGFFAPTVDGEYAWPVLNEWLKSWQGQVTIAVLTFVAFSIVEPMFVACGFALYLNRRTALEGWDLELAFRRLAQRAAAAPAPGLARSSLGTVAGALLVGWLGTTQSISLALQAARCVAAPQQIHPDMPASPRLAIGPHGSAISTAYFPATPLGVLLLSGAASAQDPPAPQDPDRVIGEVLTDPEFERFETRRLRKPEASRHKSDSGSGLDPFVQALAYAVLAAGVVTIVILIVRGGARHRRASDTEKPSAALRPAVLFGLDLRPESLPANLAAAARALWQAGNAAGCLALLYRGALAHLIDHRRLQPRAGDTEGDCARALAAQGGAQVEFFARLTRAWQSCAYAHRPPDAATALAFCDGFDGQFPRKA